MNYAEELLHKLELHRDTDLLDIDTDINTLIDLAKNAANENGGNDDEVKELKEKVRELESEAEEFDGAISELETSKAVAEKLSVSSTKEWGLLGEQIVDEINEIMRNPKTNQVKFLQMLQLYNKRRS